MTTPIPALLADPRMIAARRYLEAQESVMLARQEELSAIPAPTGAEARRGARVAALFRALGLDATSDTVGNVTACIPGLGDGRADAPVVVAAHLDTVFGTEVDVAVRRNGARLEGPGISDNARGLAALVAVAEAILTVGLRPTRPVHLVATVGEEGAGDLRGARHLLDAPAQSPTAFIALDGAGLNRIIHRAVGARRYRVTYRGPGGHSWTAYGVVNAAGAVGRAIALLEERTTNGSTSRTTCSVVGLGGGTSLNTIPREAWFDLDLRSEAGDALRDLDRDVQTAIATAAEAENRRRRPGTSPLTAHVAVLGDRPAGATPDTHPLVAAAVEATRALGIDPQLAAGSTDASAAIGRGIPAIALGAGGRAGDTHLPSEWFENTDGALGPVRVLLVMLAVAGLP